MITLANYKYVSRINVSMVAKKKPKREKKVLAELKKVLKSEEVAAHTSRVIEDKVFEIKAMVYLSFAINLMLLFLVLGVLLKLMGF